MMSLHSYYINGCISIHNSHENKNHHKTKGLISALLPPNVFCIAIVSEPKRQAKTLAYSDRPKPL